MWRISLLQESVTVLPIAFPAVAPWRKRLPRPKVLKRDEMLLALATDKTVLHVGAVDAPLTREKYENGRLLHLKLRQVARQVVGIDVDAEAVAYLREQSGIDDIIVTDISDDRAYRSDGRLNQAFDLIYCCDIIEHVTNPGGLINSLLPFCSESTKLVFTTPNALSIRAVLRPIVSGQELVHPDHVAYYSFSTLAELFRRHQVEPVEYGVYASPMRNPLSRLFLKPLWAMSPNSADGIIMIGKPRKFL